MAETYEIDDNEYIWGQPNMQLKALKEIKAGEEELIHFGYVMRSITILPGEVVEYVKRCGEQGSDVAYKVIVKRKNRLDAHISVGWFDLRASDWEVVCSTKDSK